MQKDLFVAKQNRKRSIVSMLFSICWGVLMGFEVSISIYSDQSDTGMNSSLGYLIIILMTPFASLNFCNALLTDMVTERQSKMRESLKIMGLNQYVYAVSHLLVRLIFMSVIALIISLFIYLYNSS